MSISKKYLKSKSICKVTFKLPHQACGPATKVCIVGDFNNWDVQADPMLKLKSGDFKIVLDLEPGNSYQYRYLIDGKKWENDWKADEYVHSPFGNCENSVVII